MSNAIERRVPQQERGERRIAELLAAAEVVLSETGFEATTMKAVAQQAGASIGAVYQYFDNKEAVAHALLAQYDAEMDRRWVNLEEATRALSVEELAQRFVDVMIRFIEQHPAYIVVLFAPGTHKRDVKVQNRLRERLALVFRSRNRRLSKEQSLLVATLTLQMIKSMNSLYALSKAGERATLVEEYKLALAAYLTSRLAG
ncbi:TetR/AcrR family transcriptional regulator [Granulicella sp. dw_53]|uniref:TetR/AcrR family transcriptional regulator n=1 Tax=Granulicella sp. dw_53 TaxID=2719792 RepID=UPI001BD5876C|nr:TetR/AcrR family transcriptional regulator [Granulicella sp. dw_53]